MPGEKVACWANYERFRGIPGRHRKPFGLGLYCLEKSRKYPVFLDRIRIDILCFINLIRLFLFPSRANPL